MKPQFLLLTLLPLFGSAQSRYALIDKKLKLPVLFTDSVTVEQISQGFFPVENKNVDTLIANLQYLINMVSVQQRAKMQSFELRASNTVFKVSRVPYAYGDRYSSVAETTCGEVVGKLRLIDSGQKNKKTAEELEKMLSYLKSNRSFFKEPNEITPKLYNVVVITD